MASVFEQVRALVERLSPEAICDDCIADRLDPGVRHEAIYKTRELAGGPGFERSIGSCSMCGAKKTIIRKRSR